MNKPANPISDTAFWCCGLRARDAETIDPLCGDTFAKSFMDERAIRILKSFGDEKGPNALCVARHRIIDDELRKRLAADPKLLVVVIGAGFDSRSFRLDGGVWLELDEPQVIDYKNAKLPPGQCKNELHRIPIHFASETLESKLAPYAKFKSVAFVVEGVFMYLSPEQLGVLMHTLQKLFPKHALICDLMTRRFFEKYSRTLHDKLKGMGASFAKISDAPAKIFTDDGYKHVRSQSVALFAAEHGVLGRPAFLVPFIVRWFMRVLRDGYTINVFEKGQGADLNPLRCTALSSGRREAIFPHPQISV